MFDGRTGKTQGTKEQKRFGFSCEKEYVEVRDGGTDNAKLFGRFCKDVAPSSMISTQNMMYVRFYTDVAEPKNGFKAVFSIKGMVLCNFCLFSFTFLIVFDSIQYRVYIY